METISLFFDLHAYISIYQLVKMHKRYWLSLHIILSLPRNLILQNICNFIQCKNLTFQGMQIREKIRPQKAKFMFSSYSSSLGMVLTCVREGFHTFREIIMIFWDLYLGINFSFRPSSTISDRSLIS